MPVSLNTNRHMGISSNRPRKSRANRGNRATFSGLSRRAFQKGRLRRKIRAMPLQKAPAWSVNKGPDPVMCMPVAVFQRRLTSPQKADITGGCQSVYTPESISACCCIVSLSHSPGKRTNRIQKQQRHVRNGQRGTVAPAGWSSRFPRRARWLMGEVHLWCCWMRVCSPEAPALILCYAFLPYTSSRRTMSSSPR